MNKVVEVEKSIKAPRSRVWQAMVSDQSALFADAQVETDWKVGHPIRFSGEWNGKPYRDRGEILAIEEEKRLEFTHWSARSGKEDRPENYHTVKYTLTGDGNTTTINLSQSNHGDAEIDEKTRRDYAATWNALLDHLKKVAEAS